MVRFYILISGLLTTVFTSAHAESGARHVWSDQTGVEEVFGCVTLEQSAPFGGRLKDLAQHPIQVGAQVWQASMQDGRYLFLRCPDGGEGRDYLLFDVFESGSELADSQIGVHPDEMSVFNSQPAPRVTSMTAGLEVANGPLEYVVCVSNSVLNVRDESLNRVIFTVNRHDPVKPSQSWDQNKKQTVIGGQTYTFIKAEFPSRPASSNTGWVAESYVRLKSECAGAPAPPGSPQPAPSSWTFPTLVRPTHSYKAGMRAFKASRGGGARWHAACDLYRTKDEKAVSVAAGKVVRDRYYFYQGTYAIEVRHSGGKIVRYGEITGKAAPGVKNGSNLSVGQTLGYIGKVNSNCCNPMLHFEMYAGTASGPLTQGGNKFQRRKDLTDPTQQLGQWEQARFGKSW